MDEGIGFLDEFPACVGRRMDIPVRESCSNCGKVFECFAATWAVLEAVRCGRLPSNGYHPVELKELRRRHVASCQQNSLDDEHIDAFAKRVPFEVSQILLDRVLPQRSVEEAQTAAEMAALLDEVVNRDNASSCSAVVERMERKVAGSTASEQSGGMDPLVVAAAMGGYKFPWSKDRPYQAFTNGQLTQQMKQLVNKGFHLVPPLGYFEVREEFCAIHIEMNLRQAHAPRFRPTHRLKKGLYTNEERAESLDRQVIDLHWRAHSSNKPISPVNNYPTIFDSLPFDLSAAERFAQESWTPTAKVSHLHFSEEMQWEHAILQSSDIRKKWAVIERGDVRENNIVKQVGAPQIEKSLHDAVCRAGKRQVLSSIPGMVSAWMARRIAGDAPAKVSRLIALMTGDKPRDRKAVAKTMKSLENILAARMPKK